MTKELNSPEEDQELLKERVLAWSAKLGGRELNDHEVSVGKLLVAYASTGNSQELRERKRSELRAGRELYFVYPWELEALPRIFSHFESRLGLDKRKFAAKRLLLERIDNHEADAFMKLNHIQGSASGSKKAFCKRVVPPWT